MLFVCRATSQSSEGRAVNQTSVKHEYHFVEKPLEDFFCPVTSDLLLQPHLTECCGKHLSLEAATKIKGEGGACPLCKEPLLNTMLDKRFRRQVMELKVFCHHEGRGCGWQGELSALEHHIESCTIKSTGETSSITRARDQVHVHETGRKAVSDAGSSSVHRWICSFGAVI